MSIIAPCIWYNIEALEAAELYVSIFEDSKIEYYSEYLQGDGWPSDLESGTPLNVRFTLCGQEFNAVNGGVMFKPNPSISFFVDCENKEQLNKLWRELSKEGEILMELDEYPFSPCFGWLNDRYGVSWQFSMSGLKQKITPYLMFTGKAYGKAEEAIKTYCSIFSGSKILDIMHYEGDKIPEGEREGTVMHGSFLLKKQNFMAVDSGLAHNFNFTEGVSFIVYCENQQEIDYLWEELTDGGEEQPCGWLKDKFGVSWQIDPKDIEELTDTKDPVRGNRVNKALIEMTKIDVEKLRAAYRGD